MHFRLLVIVVLAGCMAPGADPPAHESDEPLPYPDEPGAAAAWAWELPAPGDLVHCARCTATASGQYTVGYFQDDDGPEMCSERAQFRDDGRPMDYLYVCWPHPVDYVVVHSARAWTVTQAEWLLLESDYQSSDPVPPWAGRYASERVPGDVNVYPDGDFPARGVVRNGNFTPSSYLSEIPAGGYDKVRIDVARWDGAESNITEVQVLVHWGLEFYVNGTWVVDATLPVVDGSTTPFLLRPRVDDPLGGGLLEVVDMRGRFGEGHESVYTLPPHLRYTG